MDQNLSVVQQQADLKYGVASVNEVRRKRALPPVPWGDVPWLPRNRERTDAPRGWELLPELGRRPMGDCGMTQATLFCPQPRSSPWSAGSGPILPDAWVAAAVEDRDHLDTARHDPIVHHIAEPPDPCRPDPWTDLPVHLRHVADLVEGRQYLGREHRP
ncbi:MAG TPA: hypothetical protein VMS17_30400 [Gemmataceae bacterium]|nr:hypothetical protein [Gemmataceae bacterium]